MQNTKLLYLTLSIILVFISSFSFALTKDTVSISLSELRFNSEIEKETFEKIANNPEISYVDLFMGLKEKASKSDLKEAKEFIEKLLIQVKSVEIKSNKKEKGIKKIAQIIHSNSFKKYQLQIDFDKIFSNGEYNCLTASALFAIIFEELKIPYKIIELPTHVYLIAYPEEKMIVVETTDAVSNYVVYNNVTKKKYIDYLLESKQISSEEFSNSTIDELFDKHFFGESEVNLKQLAGLHYYNSGLSMYENQDYQKSSEQFAKAYYLFPSERIKYMMLISLSATFLDAEYTKSNYCLNYVLLSKLGESMIKTNVMTNEFKLLTNKLLIEEGDTSTYKTQYECIANQLNNKELHNEISFIYHYELLKIYAQKEMSIQTLEHSEKAYALKPNHIYTKDIFLESLYNSFDETKDDDANFRLIKSYIDKYPDLAKDQKVITFFVFYDLFLANDEYELKKNSIKSLQLLDEFEKKYSVEMIRKIGCQSEFEEVYGNLIMHYFKQGNKAKSKEITLRGMKYFPDSYYFQRKLNVLN